MNLEDAARNEQLKKEQREQLAHARLVIDIVKARTVAPVKRRGDQRTGFTDPPVDWDKILAR